MILVALLVSRYFRHQIIPISWEVGMHVQQLESGEFQVTRQDLGRVTVLTLAGELDMATTPMLREALDALDGECSVVLDVGDLTFVDSNGLHAIFSRTTAHDLALARPHPNVVRLLELTKCERMVPIHDTVEAALAAANS